VASTGVQAAAAILAPPETWPPPSAWLFVCRLTAALVRRAEETESASAVASSARGTRGAERGRRASREAGPERRTSSGDSRGSGDAAARAAASSSPTRGEAEGVQAPRAPDSPTASGARVARVSDASSALAPGGRAPRASAVRSADSGALGVGDVSSELAWLADGGLGWIVPSWMGLASWYDALGDDAAWAARLPPSKGGVLAASVAAFGAVGKEALARKVEWRACVDDEVAHQVWGLLVARWWHGREGHSGGE
jgi:hypothetical protein